MYAISLFMRTPHLAARFIAALLVVAAVVVGCSDSTTPEKLKESTALSVSIAPTSVSAPITETYSFSATVTNGTDGAVRWSVNGVDGGNASVGTITQAAPAVYTSPDAIPLGVVWVAATSTEDTTRSDSCRVLVTNDVVYVDVRTGNDTTGVGGKFKPFKTLTRGISRSSAGGTVWAAAGVYDAPAGEQFPLLIPDGVVVEGVDWEQCIIRVNAESLGVLDAAFVSCMDCGFRKFKLEEVDTVATYWNNPVEMSGCTRAHVDSLLCYERANYAVLRVAGDHQSIVENCRFVVNDGLTLTRGVEIVFNDTGNGTIFRRNTVAGYSTGIEFNFPQETLVEDCNLSGNQIGAHLCCFQNSTSQPAPDFGGGSRGSAGGNDFSGNPACGLRNDTANAIFAKFNTWSNTPPAMGVDFCVPDSSNGGAVVTQ